MSQYNVWSRIERRQARLADPDVIYQAFVEGDRASFADFAVAPRRYALPAVNRSNRDASRSLSGLHIRFVGNSIGVP